MFRALFAALLLLDIGKVACISCTTMLIHRPIRPQCSCMLQCRAPVHKTPDSELQALSMHDGETNNSAMHQSHMHTQ